MAIPDPHMEDLRLMTYDERPRACKMSNRIPRRQEFIKVLWCLDHLPNLPERWCTAEVLHVTGSPKQDTLAHGVIRYMTDDTWNEEIHTVEFLADHKLRRTHEESTVQDEEHSSGNPNPITEWQFTRVEQSNLAPSDDEEWTEERHNPFKANSKKGIPSTTLQGKLREELHSLRGGYSALAVDMEKVKRELLAHSQVLRPLQNEDQHGAVRSGARCVLRSLKHRLGLKMKMGLRTVFSVTGKRASKSPEQTVQVRTGDGLHVDILKARVECTLHQFEVIARQVKAVVPHQYIFFVPDFSYRQLPSLSSSAFRIMFSTFYDMASFLGVTAISDLMEMTRKCGTGPQGDILRILGTSKYDAENPSSAASIYLGTSCGVPTTPAPVTTDATTSPKTFPILERRSREWNQVDCRFLQPLAITKTSLSDLSACSSKVQAFAMDWKRGSELGSRTWSRSMIEPGQVFGWLELTIPFIQVEGQYLCEEVGGLANDDVWETLLARKSTSSGGDPGSDC